MSRHSRLPNTDNVFYSWIPKYMKRGVFLHLTQGNVCTLNCPLLFRGYFPASSGALVVACPLWRVSEHIHLFHGGLSRSLPGHISQMNNFCVGLFRNCAGFLPSCIDLLLGELPPILATTSNTTMSELILETFSNKIWINFWHKLWPLLNS